MGHRQPPPPSFLSPSPLLSLHLPQVINHHLPPLPSSPLNSPLNSHPTLISPYPPSSPFLYDLCSSSVPSFLLPYVFLNPSVPNHSVAEKDYPAVCPQDSDSPILENDLLPESHLSGGSGAVLTLPHSSPHPPPSPPSSLSTLYLLYIRILPPKYVTRGEDHSLG